MRNNILLMYSNHRPTVGHVARLKKIAPEFDVKVAISEAVAISSSPKSEIILGHRYLRQCLPYAMRLKWVQTTGGGVDHLPVDELKKRNVLLTRTAFPSYVIAQHAYMLAWALIRKLKDCFLLQQKKEWTSSIEMLPCPKTALIVGFGNIGHEIAKLLKAANIRVYGAKRHLDEISENHCDKLFDSNSWRQVLPEVDICFICLPLTEETKGIFDESVLRCLPKHAVIVNVGRGGTLDIKAVVRLLKEGRLGGVALDVLDPQPPSIDDQVWETPNLIITPYVAGRYPQRAEGIESYMEDQLIRYLNNHDLANVVDWDEVKTEIVTRV